MQDDLPQYKSLKLPHPTLIFWVLMPTLALNELILGQRIPKLMLIDLKDPAPLMERQYIPCPQCGALNDARLWGKGNAFGHWFGYICPKCHGAIPCLWNWTSVLLLILTSPLWIPLKKIVEPSWKKNQIQKLERMTQRAPITSTKFLFLKMGIVFATLMFILLCLWLG